MLTVRVARPALLALLAAFAVTATAQVTAIKAGLLVDPAAGKATPNQVILVENGRVTKIGESLAIPTGAKVIDLSTQAVLPGLFDCHTHLCMNVQIRRDAGNYFFTTLVDSNARRAVQGVANAKAMLEAGFTTCRDVGNEGNYACSEVRWGIERGLVPGPTILNAGRIIAPYGAQFQLQPDKPDLGEPEYFYADSQDEMRKGVRMNAHYGAKLIKIVVDDQNYIYSVDDIKFIVAEAARAGLKVAAHCWTEQGARNASEARVASIEHGFEMSDEALSLAKKHGVYIVGTEFPISQMIAFGSSEEQAKRENLVWVDRLRRSHKIGNKIAFGTDAIAIIQGSDRGKDAITWIESYIAADIPAPDILKAMTSSAADLLGIADQRGAIAPGQWADIIAVPTDPLKDIRQLYKVSFVMKNGKIVKGG